MSNPSNGIVRWFREPQFRDNVFKWAFRTLLNRKTVDEQSVRWAFRTLLDREPDSQTAIDAHCNAASITDLVENISRSSEFHLRFNSVNSDSIRLAGQLLVNHEPVNESLPADELQVTILQTCDAQHYFPMLACGRTVNEQYAINNGFSYTAFVGIKRGYFPWHATFNRVVILKELCAAGYRGWAFYLDADAYVRDPSFDLRQYLERHKDKHLIAATGGVTNERWEINAGVFLINLGHPDGRRLVDLWHWHYMATPDGALRVARDWDDVQNDQTRLHEILKANPELTMHLHVENASFQDQGHGGFVRQVMRCLDMTVDERTQEMRRDIAQLKF